MLKTVTKRSQFQMVAQKLVPELHVAESGGVKSSAPAVIQIFLDVTMDFDEAGHFKR